MTVTFETTFDDMTEFGCEVGMVEEVVDAKTRTGSFAGIGWTDTFLRGSDA